MFTNFENMSELNEKVEFHTHEVSVSLRNRKKLKSFISSIIKDETGKKAAISFVFCSDEYLLKINQQYLNHDYFTNVITFDLSEAGSIITGEIYISIDRVKDNAAVNKTSFIKELHRVIFHGALHLAGQTDITPAQSKQMRKMEDFYLSKYFE